MQRVVFEWLKTRDREWWTFAGGAANTLLAFALEESLGKRVSCNKSSVVVAAERQLTRKQVARRMRLDRGSRHLRLCDTGRPRRRKREAFYRGTWQLTIRHQAGVVRYCELEANDIVKSWSKGMPVKAGQMIAYVGKMYRDSMLHLELYTGAAAGALTVLSNAGFQRRADLVDPAPLLHRLSRDVVSAEGSSMMSSVMERLPG